MAVAVSSAAPNPLQGYKAPPQPALPLPPDSPFPYATAPDIIRAHQKDAYFQGFLAQSFSHVHRRLLGARSAHAWAAESKTLAALIYLGLTTLVGHQTLGEEYCDIIQVHPTSRSSQSNRGGKATALGIKTPTAARRSAYILGSTLVPYLLSRSLPRLRSLIRGALEGCLTRAKLERQKSLRNSKPPVSQKIAAYLLTYLPTLTDPTNIHALSLALFYFTGSYYEISKRLTSLRYVFARIPPELAAPSPSGAIGGQRGGYEVLGVLLALQLAVQGYQHVHSVLSPAPSPVASNRERPGMFMATTLSNIDDSYASNTSLLPSNAGVATKILSSSVNTPVPPGGCRYDLENDRTMRWMKGASARKCTLCLEAMRDPASTACGHVFCWECIGDWVREKPECPLCRREVAVSHVLPLRGF